MSLRTGMHKVLEAGLATPERILVSLLRISNKYPPTFIVGAPRSGTTVVYQHVVNAFQVSYFPNISKWHPMACVSYGAIAKKRYTYEPSYDSQYGITEGPMAPSDGWGIFHRWFPRYNLNAPVREDNLHELKSIVRLFEILFRAPFVNKNNANSVRIRQLAKLFPNSLFVHVRRNLYDAVFSLLKSREKHAVPETEWWGVPPPQYYDRQFGSELERAVSQIWGVDAHIGHVLSEIPEGRRLTLDYETFCNEPSLLTDWIDRAYEKAGVTISRRLENLPERFRVERKEFDGRAALEVEIDAIVNLLRNNKL